jgi:hypothetical protein
MQGNDFHLVRTVYAVWVALNINEHSLRQVRYAKLQDGTLWGNTLDLEPPISGLSLDCLHMRKVLTLSGDWQKADVLRDGLWKHSKLASSGSQYYYT